MLDYGSRYADRRQAIIEQRIRRIYREAQKELEKKLEKFVWDTEKQENEKQRQIKAGLITEDQYKNWRLGREFRTKQWEDKVKSVTETLLHANQRSLNVIRREQYKVFSENANFQSFQIEKDAKGGIRFDIYDETTVSRLIREKPKLLPPKVINGKKDRAWNQGIIANSVTQGIIQGDSIPKLAKRIAKNVSSRDMKAMTMYARTAMTAAQNAGRLETMHRAEDMGIKVKKVWMATLDKRTRHAHAELDGQAIDIDEPFVNSIGEIDYPGDPDADNENVWNCRCTLTYEYPDYSHMPEQENNVRYDQEFDEEIEFMDYDEWKDLRESEKELFTSEKSQVKIEEEENTNNLERIAQLKDELASDEEKIQSMLDYSSLDLNSVEEAAEALFGYGSDPEHCYFDGADSEIRSRATDEASKRADAIQKYIDASPKAEGTIYRGMAIPKEMLDNLQIGTEFNEKDYAVSSWSTREDIGQRYASNSKNKYGGERVVFQYSNPKHGTPVAHLSPTPIEQEVLVNNKNCNYRIIGREDYTKKGATGERKFTRIILEEIEGEENER